MSDRTFEWSVIALTMAALIWMVLGVMLHILGTPWVIITGLIVWLVGSGALLYYWGKDYMSRM